MMDKETKDLILSLLRDGKSPWWIAKHYNLPERVVQGYAGMLRSIDAAMREAGMEYEHDLVRLRRAAVQRAMDHLTTDTAGAKASFLLAESIDDRLRDIRGRR